MKYHIFWSSGWATFIFPMSTKIRCLQMWKCTISTIHWTRNKANIFVLKYMKHHTRYCSGHGSVPENNEQHFKFTVYNSAQKAQLCKRSGNRQCPNGHNGDHLADFSSTTTKSGIIKATSRYTCAIVNQNCVGIGPNSAISARGSSGCFLK